MTRSGLRSGPSPSTLNDSSMGRLCLQPQRVSAVTCREPWGMGDQIELRPCLPLIFAWFVPAESRPPQSLLPDKLQETVRPCLPSSRSHCFLHVMQPRLNTGRSFLPSRARAYSAILCSGLITQILRCRMASKNHRWQASDPWHPRPFQIPQVFGAVFSPVACVF